VTLRESPAAEDGEKGCGPDECRRRIRVAGRVHIVFRGSRLVLVVEVRYSVKKCPFCAEDIQEAAIVVSTVVGTYRLRLLQNSQSERPPGTPSAAEPSWRVIRHVLIAVGLFNGIETLQVAIGREPQSRGLWL
jgi:hypothetical protein